MQTVMPGALFPTHKRTDLSFETGEGAYLFGSDGRRYLDFFCGIAVTGLGHAHPHLVHTAREYSKRVWHISNNYRIPEQERLAERLVAHSFADRVYFCNSGAEAIEGAIKLARRYQFDAGQYRRRNIVTISGAFHGRSLAALAATNKESYLEGFDPVMPGFIQVPFNDQEALEASIDDHTAAVMIEPIQGEGGVRPCPLDYLRNIRRMCDENGALLIFDEVQCGIGRTGKLFAYEWAGIKPDIMTLAKGLGGGFPIGAFLATENIAASLVPGTHGSTFGGNPFATAIANAVLDVVLADGFLDEVDRLSRVLWARLQSVVDAGPDRFAELRGAGLLLGIKCVALNHECVSAVREAGMLTHIAGDNVLRLLPPLIIREQQIDEAIEHLQQGIALMSKRVDAA